MTIDKQGSDPALPVYAGLKVMSGERAGLVQYPLKASTLIGRLRAVDVFLPDAKCSRRHCLVHWNGARYVLVDVSANGTWLNDAKVDTNTETPLAQGDVIRCGETELEFRLAGVAPAVAATRNAPAPPPVASVPILPSHTPIAPQPRLPASFAPQATGPAPPVELVFDFGPGDDSKGGGLDKVFFDHENEKWSSHTTQRMPRVDENDPGPSQ